ncbi:MULTISPECIES: hypothetical protein [Bacillus]|uniref:hypothetical protein n=1 Tax=Bacillus TaxID=1386 RepID=UPI000B2907DE|nr:MULTISPECIES: hypothetical protein [Bacillus cereus group]MCU5279443.1 hypothetical protein [Bacillus cereus]MED0951018.1 hypothetical protein [Bacillus mobilis]
MDLKKNNNGRYWAKALTACVGVISISTLAYLMNDPFVLVALLFVLAVVDMI